VTVAWRIVLAASAGIVYDGKQDLLWVTDFPAGYPCTLKLLAAADRRNGWGKVSHDEASGTYVVNCHLLIGANDGTTSCFQIGTREAPAEALRLQGNLCVAPFWVEGENDGKYWQAPVRVNRLTLGSADDPGIRAALRFDNRRRGEFGLVIGDYPPGLRTGANAFGGQIHVYNSVITAARQEAAFACAGFRFGQETVLENAELSWSAGDLGYGLHAAGAGRTVRIRGTLFAHSGEALSNGTVTANDCTFRNLRCAVSDSGCIDATLVNCTFENNARNWYLRFSPRGIVCIDCSIGAPAKADLFQAETTASVKEKRYGTVFCKRHVVVEVVDSQGKPVAGAQVTIHCEQAVTETVENRQQTTGAAGRTPGTGEERAILLTEYTRKVTDTPGQPEVREYSYTIQVEAKGFAAGTVAGVKPVESWQVVRVALK
jgi:hypothetical protein